MKLQIGTGKIEKQIIDDFQSKVKSYILEDHFECICNFTMNIGGVDCECDIEYHPEAFRIYDKITCFAGDMEIKLKLIPQNYNPNATTLKTKLADIISYANDELGDSEIDMDYKNHL